MASWLPIVEPEHMTGSSRNGSTVFFPYAVVSHLRL